MPKNIDTHLNNQPDLFDHWIGVKRHLHQANRLPHISEGEVWWCGIGENVGVEINGKSAHFSRPVVIYKKLNIFGFLGIPLSTQLHEGSWYVPFRFQGKDQVATLAQVRTISTNRLYRRMGVLSKKDFQLIKKRFLQLYS